MTNKTLNAFFSYSTYKILFAETIQIKTTIIQYTYKLGRTEYH